MTTREHTGSQELCTAILITSLGVAMRQAVTTRPTRAHVPQLTLNSDGQRHPLLNVTTAVTFCAGIAAFALGLVVRAHLAATIIGLVTFAVGLYAQLVSATREQRIFIVTGVVGAFVGMGLGIAHGGFG
ncbi:MAG: hypothetical protein ACRDOK_31030 [Streptosporangiaceae bacterium]